MLLMVATAVVVEVEHRHLLLDVHLGEGEDDLGEDGIARAVGDAPVEAHIGDAEHRVVGVLPGEVALGIGEQLVKVVEMLGAGIGGGQLPPPAAR